MRIAQLLPSNCDVRPGGSPWATGNVVRDLGEALVRRGHAVTLYGPATAVTTMALRPTVAAPVSGWLADEATERAGAGPRTAELRQTALLYREAGAFDVLHCHLGNFGFVHPVFFAGLVGRPTVATVHCPASQLPLGLLREFARDVVLVSPSATHAASLGALPRLAVIPHGVDTQRFRFGARPDRQAVFAGRLMAGKGVAVACQAARRAGVHLDVIGRMPSGPAPWVRRLRGLLSADGITYHGELDQDGVARHLRRARVLLAPFRGEESFGLVVAEALSCGTPVVAFPAGAVDDLVLPGITGHVVRDVAQMAAAVRDIASISRADCADHIRQSFALDSVARRYEELFASLSGGAARDRRSAYADTCAAVQESACVRSLGAGTGDGTGPDRPSAASVASTTAG